MTYVVSSLLSTISSLSKNQPGLAWLLSCRILSFFRTPRSTAVMLKMSSWVERQAAKGQDMSYVFITDIKDLKPTLEMQHKCQWYTWTQKPYLTFLKFVQVVGFLEPSLPCIADLSIDVDINIGIGPCPPHSPSEHMNLIWVHWEESRVSDILVLHTW